MRAVARGGAAEKWPADEGCSSPLTRDVKLHRRASSVVARSLATSDITWRGISVNGRRVGRASARPSQCWPAHRHGALKWRDEATPANVGENIARLHREGIVAPEMPRLDEAPFAVVGSVTALFVTTIIRSAISVPRGGVPCFCSCAGNNHAGDDACRAEMAVNRRGFVATRGI